MARYAFLALALVLFLPCGCSSRDEEKRENAPPAPSSEDVEKRKVEANEGVPDPSWRYLFYTEHSKRYHFRHPKEFSVSKETEDTLEFRRPLPDGTTLNVGFFRQSRLKEEALPPRQVLEEVLAPYREKPKYNLLSLQRRDWPDEGKESLIFIANVQWEKDGTDWRGKLFLCRKNWDYYAFFHANPLESFMKTNPIFSSMLKTIRTGAPGKEDLEEARKPVQSLNPHTVKRDLDPQSPAKHP